MMQTIARRPAQVRLAVGKRSFEQFRGMVKCFSIRQTVCVNRLVSVLLTTTNMATALAPGHALLVAHSIGGLHILAG